MILSSQRWREGLHLCVQKDVRMVGLYRWEVSRKLPRRQEVLIHYSLWTPKGSQCFFCVNGTVVGRKQTLAEPLTPIWIWRYPGQGSFSEMGTPGTIPRIVCNSTSL